MTILVIFACANNQVEKTGREASERLFFLLSGYRKSVLG
jgi:hypothetical protein